MPNGTTRPAVWLRQLSPAAFRGQPRMPLRLANPARLKFNSRMLTAETLRDVSRTLPWLASKPGGTGKDATLADVVARKPVDRQPAVVDGCAAAMRDRYETLYPVLHRLEAEVESASSEEITDPDGEAAVSLEATEAYFDRERRELGRLRAALADAAGAEHPVFDELARLDAFFTSLIARLQQIRWTLLIADGVRAPTTGRTFRSGKALVAALDAP